MLSFNWRVGLLFLLLIFTQVILLPAQTLKDKLQPVVKNAGFKMEGYYTWCPTVIKVGKTFHLFASRWPAESGMGGWTSYSEIVRATADKVLGPYTF